jgi:hypothetical protein
MKRCIVQNRHLFIFLTMLVSVGGLIPSCTKNPHSIGGQPAANINIFNASHVYDSMVKARNVYLSGLDTASLLSQLSFPGLRSYEIPDNGQVEAIRFDHPMHYNPFLAGRQRIQFADTAGAIVADTSLDFAAGGDYGVYLADDTVKTGSYRSGKFRIFSFPENNVGNTPGKMRLRYIDLVPDVDKLSGYFLSEKGDTLTIPQAPHSLQYGTASEFTDLDTTGIVVGGQLLLRLYKEGNIKSAYTQVSLPATPGRTYTVLLFGNAAFFLCQFPIKQKDGSTVLKTINYAPRITAYARTVY